MVDVAMEPCGLLDAMVDAYARGDNDAGERLFAGALEYGVPWDEVTRAAARGIARRFESRRSISLQV
jgi:hypothetical protein